MQMWFGVVEERSDIKAKDGLRLGRVRVRIYGKHSKYKIENDFTGEGIPVDDLFWAYPMLPVDSASLNGIGQSPTGIVEGTNVIGFSRDKMFQDLIIIGTYNGIMYEKPDTKYGFCDPSGTYPQIDWIGEPDVNRLARVEKLDETLLPQKKKDRNTGIKIANSGSTWDEKENPYNATYPFNHVRETESGHVVEFDDTKGSERIHEWHTTGTFYEVHPDGSKVTKVIGDNFNVVLKDDHLYVKGDCHVHIDGDSTVYVKGNLNTEVGGDSTMCVKGNLNTEVGGDYNLKVAGKISTSSNGFYITAGNLFKLVAKIVRIPNILRF